jgi:hypothetical protein
VDADGAPGILQRHVRRDAGAEVAAVRTVPLVAEASHQPVPEPRDLGAVDAGARRACGEAVTGQRGDHHVVLGQPVEQRQQFDERARPAVGQDQRYAGAAALAVHEVDPGAVDVGEEVLVAVEVPLGGAPVVPVRPVRQHRAQVAEVGALAPRGSGRRIGPAGVADPCPQVVEDGVRDVDRERLDAHSRDRSWRRSALSWAA